MQLDVATEALAAAGVLAAEAAAVRGDKKARQDLIEGQTNLVEALREKMTLIDRARRLSLEAAEEECKAKSRKQKLAEEAMQLELEVANALASVAPVTVDKRKFNIKSTPPKVIITDEAAIPEQHKRIKTKQEVDKTSISAALKRGETVPGATLSNGGLSLVVTAI